MLKRFCEKCEKEIDIDETWFRIKCYKMGDTIFG